MLFYQRNMVRLRGEGFTLRPYRKTDIPALTKYLNNKKIYKNTLHIPYPYTKKNASTWIATCRRKSRGLRVAIEVEKEAVGGMGVMNVEGHKAELGYWLAEPYWNRGIMTKAVKLITEYCFSKMGFRRIYATTYTFNKASQRVLEKAGFVKEGLMQKNVQKNGKLYDNILFAKVK